MGTEICGKDFLTLALRGSNSNEIPEKTSQSDEMGCISRKCG